MCINNTSSASLPLSSAFPSHNNIKPVFGVSNSGFIVGGTFKLFLFSVKGVEASHLSKIEALASNN